MGLHLTGKFVMTPINEDETNTRGIYEGTFGNNYIAVAKPVGVLEEKERDRYNIDYHILENHENVLRLFFVHEGEIPGENNSSRFLVMERCESNLENYVASDTFEAKADFLFQIAVGVSWLHQNNVFHRRLHPRNILLKDLSASRKRIVLADCFDNPENIYFQEWRIPDIVDYRRNDIFAGGCLFYYILTKGSHPFRQDEHDNENVTSNITAGIYDVELKNLKSIAGYRYKLAQDLIKSMIISSGNYYKMEDVVAHPFFWSTNNVLTFIEKVSSFCEDGRNHKLDTLPNMTSNTFSEDWIDKLKDNDVKDYLCYSPYANESGQKRKLRKTTGFLRTIRNKSIHWFNKSSDGLQRKAVRKMREALNEIFKDVKNPNEKIDKRQIFCYWIIELFAEVVIRVWEQVKTQKHPLTEEFFSITPTEYLYF